MIGFSMQAHAETARQATGIEALEADKWRMSINPTLPPQQFVDDKTTAGTQR